MKEHSPKYEKQLNGEAERAVQTAEGIARTFKEALQIATGSTIPAESPILAWLVEHAANAVNAFHLGAPGDGYTAYQRVRGVLGELRSPLLAKWSSSRSGPAISWNPAGHQACSWGCVCRRQIRSSVRRTDLQGVLHSAKAGGRAVLHVEVAGDPRSALGPEPRDRTPCGAVGADPAGCRDARGASKAA